MGILCQSIYIISGDKVQWYNEDSPLSFHYITNCHWHLSEKNDPLAWIKGNWHGNVQILSQSRKYKDIEILYQLSNDKPLIYMIGCPITPKMFNEPERRLFLIKYFIIAYKIGCAWLHNHSTSPKIYLYLHCIWNVTTMAKFDVWIWRNLFNSL